jgi:hypothetical protein
MDDGNAVVAIAGTGQYDNTVEALTAGSMAVLIND